MDYEEFLQYIKNSMDIIIGKGERASIHHIIKNNGIELDGLVIADEKTGVSPTIYLNEYFQEYLACRPIGEIVSDVYEVYETSRNKLTIDKNFFLNYEQISKKIVYKLINYELNKKMLNDVPHRRYLDLAIVYYCIIDHDEMGTATALIHNSYLDMWNVTKEAIHNIAVRNTPALLPARINRIEEVIYDIFMEENDKEVEDAVRNMKNDCGGVKMYVVTNCRKINGAACILYEGLLEEFAKEKKCDFYIIPSSVHEVILVPKNDKVTKEELESMVCEINENEVSEYEVLSNKIYEYIREDRKIIL